MQSNLQREAGNVRFTAWKLKEFCEYDNDLQNIVSHGDMNALVKCS